ncbi:ABC transporter ATP-binding protein [Candidatus Saganbacteria bacterium]|nr:ABC transporter ATP-binding protein [Candidatus Saganbacteria bacterium]
MKLYLRLLEYLKPYKIQIFWAALSMLILSVANILLIPLIGKLSEAIGNRDFGLLNLVVIGAVSIYFLRGLSMYGQGYLMAYAGHRLVTDLRKQLYRHLQDLSLDFFAKWRTGEVISRVMNDINVVQNATISAITEILPNLITLLGVLGYLFYLNWRLTLITLIVIPLLSFVIKIFGREMREVSRESQKKQADIASLLQESLAGVRVVKSFAMEKNVIEKFNQEAEKSFWLTLKQSQITVTQTPLLAFLNALAIVAIIWYGGFEVVSGRLSPSNLIAFFAGIALIADPASRLGNISTVIQNALASAERIFEVIDIKPSVAERPDARELNKISGKVEFKNLTFSYEKGEAPVLTDIDLEIKPGEIIALVGRSGAGKSSLVNLIPRFYDPQKGMVLVDGHDLKDVKLQSLRSQLGMVPQETILFSGTIGENIAYARSDATTAEIESAAKTANAHDFIMGLPEGYDTLVGERGVRLSGGERQRVAIARAILADPRILIFDEATSALDAESERLVQEAMDNLMAGRTTLIIAHRLSTVQHADRIVVLDKGKIMEVGKHSELIEKGGLYAKLYEMQFKDEENNIPA